MQEIDAVSSIVVLKLLDQQRLIALLNLPMEVNERFFLFLHKISAFQF